MVLLWHRAYRAISVAASVLIEHEVAKLLISFRVADRRHRHRHRCNT